jgi:small subunit ribosomal protein S20
LTIAPNSAILLNPYAKKTKEVTMPIHTAACKSLRADAKKHKRNQAAKAVLKSITKKLEDLVAEKKKDEALKSFKIASSKYMKAASKGIIHKKTASRKISRLAKRVNSLK